MNEMKKLIDNVSHMCDNTCMKQRQTHNAIMRRKTIHRVNQMIRLHNTFIANSKFLRRPQHGREPTCKHDDHLMMWMMGDAIALYLYESVVRGDVTHEEANAMIDKLTHNDNDFTADTRDATSDQLDTLLRTR